MDKEQTVSDAMIEAGREKITSLLRLVPQSLPIEAEIAAREIYLAMKAASHPLEQQQAVNGDVVERFFIDHGMIHDRVTGRHVATDPEMPGLNETMLDDALELLNSLHRAALTASGVGRMHPNGDAGDAIDFACGHCGPEEAIAFLDDWRADRAGEWPGYVKWLAVQRKGAAKARTALQEEGVKRRD